jgi:hypothetical protein
MSEPLDNRACWDVYGVQCCYRGELLAEVERLRADRDALRRELALLRGDEADHD